MQEKLMELTLYISGKSEGDPKFGLIKLNKILFAADFAYFGSKGKSITGVKYIHIQNGPAPVGMKDVLDELVSQKKAEIKETDYFGYPQKRVMPLLGANTSLFTMDELVFVDEYIKHFTPFNGSQLSDWTHTLIPWLLTDINEEIPYHCVFSMKELPIERAVIVWAQKELDRLRSEESYAY